MIAQNTDKKYKDLLKESPFNSMYPKFMAEDAAEYFKEFNMLFSDKSPIATKEARLARRALLIHIQLQSILL